MIHFTVALLVVVLLDSLGAFGESDGTISQFFGIYVLIPLFFAFWCTQQEHVHKMNMQDVLDEQARTMACISP